MYRIFLSSIIGIIVITAASFVPIQSSRAIAAGCTIESATITAKNPGPLGNDTVFDELYSEATRKNNPVTITITTNDCAGQEVFVSIAGSIIGSGNTPHIETIAGLAKKKFLVPSSNKFTVTMLPGEDGCEAAGLTADCKIRVHVFTSVNASTFFDSRDKLNGNLDYECEGFCTGSKWEYVTDTSDNASKKLDACVIKDVLFDPWNEAAFVYDKFYSSNNRKIVTITVNTEHCAGRKLFVTLSALRVGVSNLLGISALNNKEFILSPNSEQLIIKMTPGEEACMTGMVPEAGGECQYYVSVTPENGTAFLSKDQTTNKRRGVFRYMCDGVCDVLGENWEINSALGQEKPATVSVEPGSFSTGVDPESNCYDETTGSMIPNCYSLFSGFADALGNKITKISTVDSLGGLFNAIIAFAIGAAGVVAVGRIIILGFKYMTARKSGKTIEIGEVKSEMGTVILGLLLLLCIYVILRTINPDLLNLMPRIDSAAFKTGGDTAAPVPLATKADLRKNAATYGISCPGTGGQAALAGIAQSFVGKVTYSFGAKGTVGPNNTLNLDCSGFIDVVYSCAGLPSPGAGTWNIFKGNPPATPITAASKTQINNQNMSVGDLIGWTAGSITNGKTEGSGHVVMYIGNGKTIEATSNNEGKKPGKGVQIRDADAYKLTRLKFWKKL